MPREDDLPLLNPSMLMSVAGARELEAAEAFAGRPQGVQLYADSHDRLRAIDDQGAEISLDDLDAGSVGEADPALEQMFMNGVPEQFREAHARTSVDAMPIQFDAEFSEPVGGASTPNERVRFQVGRESPPARPFSGGVQSQDGLVVSRIRPNGQVEHVPRPRISDGAGRPLAPAVPRIGGSQPLPTRTAAQSAPTPAAVVGPSLWERLADD